MILVPFCYFSKLLKPKFNLRNYFFLWSYRKIRRENEEKKLINEARLREDDSICVFVPSRYSMDRCVCVCVCFEMMNKVQIYILL